MTAAAGTCSYYIDDFADEVCPCDPTLIGWAEWLAKGGTADWAVPVPVDGAEFRAWVTAWQDDIVATRQPDGHWSFSREVADDAFLAVRFGPGLGWDCDAIVDSMASLRDFLEENDRLGGCDPVEHVAVGEHRPAVMLRWSAATATLLDAGTVQ